MTERGAAVAFYLRLCYWQSAGQVEIGYQVTGVAEVVARADQAAQIYRAAGADCLAGVSAWRGADIPENSLSLAIGPTRWAIVRTDADFLQTVTRVRGARSEPGRRFASTSTRLRSSSAPAGTDFLRWVPSAAARADPPDISAHRQRCPPPCKAGYAAARHCRSRVGEESTHCQPV